MSEPRAIPPEIIERLEKLKMEPTLVTWGWNVFDLPSNKELAKFFTTRTRAQMQKFEEDVFMKGNDPRTYIRIAMMRESEATIELSQEILDKETVFHPSVNHGGVRGHEGEEASSTSGFRNGHHPCMDNPELEYAICKDYYERVVMREMMSAKKNVQGQQQPAPQPQRNHRRRN